MNTKIKTVVVTLGATLVWIGAGLVAGCAPGNRAGYAYNGGYYQQSPYDSPYAYNPYGYGPNGRPYGGASGYGYGYQPPAVVVVPNQGRGGGNFASRGDGRGWRDADRGDYRGRGDGNRPDNNANDGNRGNGGNFQGRGDGNRDVQGRGDQNRGGDRQAGNNAQQRAPQQIVPTPQAAPPQSTNPDGSTNEVSPGGRPYRLRPGAERPQD